MNNSIHLGKSPSSIKVLSLFNSDCGVYSITSPSGKQYIGSSSKLHKRWVKHKYLLNKGEHHSRHLQNAWDKYEGNLEFKVLLICDPSNILLYEQQYLDFYKPEYNISQYSTQAFYALGVKRSDETKAKISKALMGKNTEGHSQSQASKDKLSLALRGNKNGIGNTANLGRKLPEETCKKMSESKKGSIMSEAQKEFLSESRKGSGNPMFGKIPWNKGLKKSG